MQVRHGGLMALVLVSLGGGAVASEDTKVYPGAFCVSQSGNTPDGAFQFQYPTDGGMWSEESTKIGNVICPVVTDSVGALNDIEFAQIVVWGEEQTPRCTLTTTDGRDNFVQRRVDPSSFRIDDGYTTMRFGDGGANIRTAFAGTVFFECTMPPSGRIISYMIVENVGEN